MSILLIPFVIFIMIWIAGWSYLVSKARWIILIHGLIALTLFIWSVHYFIQLNGIAELSDDQSWHRIYMVIIIITTPVAIIVTGLYGYYLHSKKYMSQYDEHLNTTEPQDGRSYK